MADQGIAIALGLLSAFTLALTNMVVKRGEDILVGRALLSSSAAVRGFGVVGLAIVAAHVLAALAVGGGGWRDLAALGGAPLYIAWKIGLAPIIGRAARRDAAWLRTERPTRGLR